MGWQCFKQGMARVVVKRKMPTNELRFMAGTMLAIDQRSAPAEMMVKNLN